MATRARASCMNAQKQKAAHIGRLLIHQEPSGGLLLNLDLCFNSRGFALHIGVGAFSFGGLVSLLSHISLYFAFVLRFRVTTMVIRPPRFNIYLLLAAALVVGGGCESFPSKSKNQIATLRVHLEAPNNPSDMTEKVSVIRTSPISVTIEKTPFLNETDISAAKVVESGDEFKLSIQLNQQGQHLLEQYSSTNPQRRFAIRSQFRQGTNVFDRWLAAPLIMRRISDGNLSFSPDADREEADTIVKGWNKAAGFKEPKKKKAPENVKNGGTK